MALTSFRLQLPFAKPPRQDCRATHPNCSLWSAAEAGVRAWGTLRRALLLAYAGLVPLSAADSSGAEVPLCG